MRIKPSLILYLSLNCIACSLLLQNAFAEPPTVSAQHSTVSSSTDADGRSWLTIAVTLSNSGDQDLSEVRLLTTPELSPTHGHDSDALHIGFLPMGGSVAMDWTFESMLAVSDGEALPGPVMFFGEATDSYGDFVTFVVNSVTGEE